MNKSLHCDLQFFNANVWVIKGIWSGPWVWVM